MNLCKYTKIDSAVFVPHLDILRAVSMGIRRAGLDVAFSEGYNPHMQLFFNQPLPIGSASMCEYFCVHTTEDPLEFMQKMNRVLPTGIQILRSGRVQKDPNVAKIMHSARYLVTMRDIIPSLERVKDILDDSQLLLSVPSKGKTVIKDVRALILGLEVPDNQTIVLKLRCGNPNLRADRLMQYLLERFDLRDGYDIVKTDMYIESGKNLDEVCF